MLHKSIPILLLSLGMLLQVSPAPLRTYELRPSGLFPVPIPGGIEPLFPVFQADLDGNGIPEILLQTRDGLSIISSSKPIWQSPSTWKVVQAAIGDLNHDGHPEVALLVWRPFRPWPVDQWLPNGGRIGEFHDATGQSCHMILIGWQRDRVTEIWAGSAMANPISSFAMADLNGDQVQELVTLEGRYSDPLSATARKLKVWGWNGFGFTVVSSLDGKFNKMTLVKTPNGRILILVP